MRRPTLKIHSVPSLRLRSISYRAGTGPKPVLQKSPRHSEWVPIKHDGHTVNSFVVYPEIKTKAPVVILIHEIFGLADWPKKMAR